MGVMAVRLAGGEVVIIIRSSCCLLSQLSQHFMLGLCKFLGDLGALVMVQSWHYWLDPTKTRSREPGNASSWLQVSSLENVEFDEKQFKNFSIFRNQALRSGEEESGSDDCISVRCRWSVKSVMSLLHCPQQRKQESVCRLQADNNLHFLQQTFIKHSSLSAKTNIEIAL